MIFISNANAASLVRIDKNTIEEITPFSYKYELVMEDNCTHCLHQLSIMKNCVDENDVIILLDNNSKKSEEKLKRLIKRKKITYKTFILSEELRKVYEFKGITPLMWINKGEARQSFTGVLSCKQLKN